MPYTNPKKDWRETQLVVCDLLPGVLELRRQGERGESVEIATRINNELLDTLIWKFSEAPGKYRGNPLWTRLAVERYRQNPPGKKWDGLIHEHAFPKSVIIREVSAPGLATAEAVSRFRQLCIGAVVTKDPEDALLRSAGLNSMCPPEALEAGRFWARYECAKALPSAPEGAFEFVEHPGLEAFWGEEVLSAMRGAGVLR